MHIAAFSREICIRRVKNLPLVALDSAQFDSLISLIPYFRDAENQGETGERGDGESWRDDL